MKKRQSVICTAAAIAMAILILDSRTAFRGAEQGINLCIRTVIPALFPFIFLSTILTNSSPGNDRVLTFPAKLFGIPANASSIWIPAFLGGYPVGAQSVYQAYRNGNLSRQAAERLLAFCSNAGPSFLFGILTLKFQKLQTVFAIWLIQLIAAWTASRIIKPDWQDNGNCAERKLKKRNPMEITVLAMGKICGWVILFRILIFFLERWFLWIVPLNARILLIGLMELSNGCCMLDLVEDASVRFVIANVLLAFGGICVVLQTSSVCGTLRIRYYVLGKMIQAVSSALLALILEWKLWFLLPVWVVILLFATGKREKKSSFLKAAVV